MTKAAMNLVFSLGLVQDLMCLVVFFCGRGKGRGGGGWQYAGVYERAPVETAKCRVEGSVAIMQNPMDENRK